ncbi:hypothetical protein [Cupriavidus pinatubonensis]|uniref:hypothetical protein n=1 Tax=Cupriavidus pinatubonensis TaxID=248026 RepID=UPI001CC55912|nr:hypothetical protein [Cupriavidus pinatubonensis]
MSLATTTDSTSDALAEKFRCMKFRPTASTSPADCRRRHPGTTCTPVPSLREDFGAKTDYGTSKVK